MKLLALAVFCAVATLSQAMTSTPAGWTDDYDAALERAAAENKLVLADFSGSDWCGWCKKLDKEVFDTEQFRSLATNEYVLLMVDSPQDEGLLSAKAKKQNPKLVEKYKVRGFPTVLVLDAKGEVVYKGGYAKGGPKKYLKTLERGIKEAPDIKKYIKPIEDVLNKYDADMQKDGEALKERLEKEFPVPNDGRWHGIEHMEPWVACVQTNATLPTAWKYFTEQFRPYVRRELAMPTEGLFAKEMGELADAVADALWEPSSGSTLEFRLSVPYELAGKLVAAGCSNLTVRSLAAQGDFRAWVTNHTGCRPKALSARLQALGSELRGGSALALHLFAVVTVDKEGLAIADRALFAATKERPQDLRTVRPIIGCPAVAREPGADPWIALLADAEAERLAAWRDRGGGFANSVTEEGWRGFAEHLEKAKAKALKAHELHPEFPDAAVLLLDIVAPQCDRAETDRWFAEVLLREVDNSDAWGTYRFHMLLRWGGSIEDLRKLSDAVWNTQRFDTRLPFFAACTL